MPYTSRTTCAFLSQRRLAPPTSWPAGSRAEARPESRASDIRLPTPPEPNLGERTTSADFPLACFFLGGDDGDSDADNPPYLSDFGGNLRMVPRHDSNPHQHFCCNSPSS
eukprot:3938034-Rhodomonas_salina.2